MSADLSSLPTTRAAKANTWRRTPEPLSIFIGLGWSVQIQIEGNVSRVSREESQTYFDKRPLKSRLSAIISPQSSPVSSRTELEQRFEGVSAHTRTVTRQYLNSGAVTGSFPNEWNSGREERTGSMIASFTP